MYGTLAALGGSAALNEVMKRDLKRTQPYAQSLGGTADVPSIDAVKLMYELDKRGMAASGKIPEVDVVYTDPAVDSVGKMAQSSRLLNENGIGIADNEYRVSINPNADKAYFAHELGHIASDRTKVGNIIRTLAGNPKLKKALYLAGLLGSGGVALAQEGTEDLDESLAVSLLAASPVLADEALATHNALGMMKDAGMPATPAQRGRLAGAYLTYLGAPLVAAVGTNLGGNLVGADY